MFKKVLFTLPFVLFSCFISRAEWEESGCQNATHAVDISASLDLD